MNHAQATLPDSSARLKGDHGSRGSGTEKDVGWVLVGPSSENGSVHRVSVSSASFVVGRHPSCNLCLSDPTVSGRHAEVVTVNDDLFVRDLNSTNGTLLNGRRLNNLTGLREGDILHFGSIMYTLQCCAPEKSSATVTADASSDALAQLQFDKLLKRPALKPYYQPVIRLSDEMTIGYEVLCRSSLVGLETPAKMFRIAAQRTAEAALSSIARSEGMRVAESISTELSYYVNTHPVELGTTALFTSLEQLRAESPESHIVVEIHEAAATSTSCLSEIRRVVHGLGMKLAYDDFGAGQARLKELFDVPPDVLKFDVKFVQGLPFATEQNRATIQSLVRIVRDLGVIPLAEGVETRDEASACLELGFELAQGYLFGRAEPASHWIREADRHAGDGT